MPAELKIELPRTPEAPALARHALADLEGTLDPSVLPEVRLLVSELITNSVKYGGGGGLWPQGATTGGRPPGGVHSKRAGLTPEAARRAPRKGGGGGRPPALQPPLG